MRNVANYASCTSAVSLRIYDQIQFCILYRNNQTNVIYILKLYTAYMRCSRENAVLHRAMGDYWALSTLAGGGKVVGPSVFGWSLC